MIASGKPEEGLSFVQAAKRLDPNFPSHYVFFDAAAHFALGNLEQAAGILSQGMTRDPRARELAPLAASIQARLGQRKEAQEAIMKWQSGLNSSDLQNAAKHYAFPIRWVNEQKDLNELLLDGLQLASLPLEVTVKSLTAELGEGSPLERLKTIRSLGWFGASAAESVPQLTAALEDTHKGVRKEAIIALGKIGPEAKAALPTIEAFTQEPIVGYHAKVALRRINGE
jgi:tetratricopeptide (TPR) repeat protein